jgi:hypothetical protein
MTRVEVQRREDLVPARRTDDEHVLRRRPLGGERERARVVVETRQARGVAVVAIDRRAGESVVEQQVRIGAELERVDAKQRAPVPDVTRVVEVALDRVGPFIGQQLGADYDRREQDAQGHRRHEGEGPAARGEPQTHEGEDQAGEHHRRRWTDPSE